MFRIDPTAALDFVWTCFHSPRLWKGRDQKSTAVRNQGTNSVSIYLFLPPSIFPSIHPSIYLLRSPSVCLPEFIPPLCTRFLLESIFNEGGNRSIQRKIHPSFQGENHWNRWEAQGIPKTHMQLLTPSNSVLVPYIYCSKRTLYVSRCLCYHITLLLQCFSLFWNIFFCFCFFFLFKAVYEKPLLDLNTTQISALTSLILSELTSNVEAWCKRKSTWPLELFSRSSWSSQFWALVKR